MQEIGTMKRQVKTLTIETKTAHVAQSNLLHHPIMNKACSNAHPMASASALQSSTSKGSGAGLKIRASSCFSNLACKAG